MMKTLTGIAAVLAISTQAALAGGLAPAVIESDVVAVEEPGMAGGLGVTGAVVGGLLGVALLAALLSDDDDDDDSSTTTTPAQ
jgi:hypothetical protein